MNYKVDLVQGTEGRKNMVVGDMDRDKEGKNHFVRTQADIAGKKEDKKSWVVENSVDVCV